MKRGNIMVSKYSWGEPISEFDGKPIYGGDCWNRMPAVYMQGTEKTGGRYPNTEEEWELFGAHLPEEVTVLKDIEISCENYQLLVAAGVAVASCESCPLLRNISSNNY
jgi:hypothetical protein